MRSSRTVTVHALRHLLEHPPRACGRTMRCDEWLSTGRTEGEPLIVHVYFLLEFFTFLLLCISTSQTFFHYHRPKFLPFDASIYAASLTVIYCIALNFQGLVGLGININVFSLHTSHLIIGLLLSHLAATPNALFTLQLEHHLSEALALFYSISPIILGYELLLYTKKTRIETHIIFHCS